MSKAPRPCSVAVCDRPAKIKGLCVGHYSRLMKLGDPGDTPLRVRVTRRVQRTCSIEGCDRDAKVRGLCSGHYSRLLRLGDPGETPLRVHRTGGSRICSIEGCDRPVKGRGWCNNHYQRWQRFGTPLGGRTRIDELSAENVRLREAIPIVTDGRFTADSALAYARIVKDL